MCKRDIKSLYEYWYDIDTLLNTSLCYYSVYHSSFKYDWYDYNNRFDVDANTVVLSYKGYCYHLSCMVSYKVNNLKLY